MLRDYYCRLTSIIILIFLFQLVGCSIKKESSEKRGHSAVDWVHWPPKSLMIANDWHKIPQYNIIEITPEYLAEAVSLLADTDALLLTPAQVIRYVRNAKKNHNNDIANDKWNYYLIRGVWAANSKIDVLYRNSTIWFRCGCLGRRIEGFIKKPYIIYIPFHPSIVYIDYIEAI